MKKLIRDNIEFYPEYVYDKFKQQLADKEQEAKEKGAISILNIGFGRDGEARLYFDRMETDNDYSDRIRMEQEVINKELNQLAILKAKYE